MDVDDIALSCSLFSDKVDNRYGLINRESLAYAAHLARLGYLLNYLPTQVQLTLTKIIKIVATR